MNRDNLKKVGRFLWFTFTGALLLLYLLHVCYYVDFCSAVEPPAPVDQYSFADTTPQPIDLGRLKDMRIADSIQDALSEGYHLLEPITALKKAEPVVPDWMECLEQSAHLDPPEPEPYVSLSEYQTQLLATCIHFEGNTESLDCQKGIGSVIINRMVAYGQTLEEVLYAKDQFEVAPLLSSLTYNETNMEAALYVIQNGPTIPKYVTFFRAGHYFDWGPRYENYTSMSNTYFTYDTHLKELLGE